MYTVADVSECYIKSRQLPTFECNLQCILECPVEETGASEVFNWVHGIAMYNTASWLVSRTTRHDSCQAEVPHTALIAV